MEPSETVTVETSEVPQDGEIMAGHDSIMDEQTISHEDEAHLLLQNVKTEGGQY